MIQRQAERSTRGRLQEEEERGYDEHDKDHLSRLCSSWLIFLTSTCKHLALLHSIICF